MLGGGTEQIAKPSKHMRPDRMQLIVTDKNAVKVLADKDVEMIEPKVDQQLFQLPRTINCTQQP